MNELLKYLFKIGYKGDINSLSTQGSLTTELKKEGAQSITWGLDLKDKPPMLVNPQPFFIEYKQGDFYGYSDSKTTDKHVHKFAPEEIYLSMIDGRALRL